MILRLAAQQARSQRRYVSLTLVFTAIAVALATFAGTTGATQAIVDSDARAMRGEDGRMFDAVLVTDGTASANEWGDPLMAVDDFNDAMSAALASGSDAVALSWASVEVTTPAGVVFVRAAALSGNYDFARFLVDGRAPRDGEAVVGSAWAERAGVSLGDTLRLAPPSWVADHDQDWASDTADVRIVGLLASTNVPVGYFIDGPELILGWSGGSLPAGLFDLDYDPENPPATASQEAYIVVTWSTQAPQLPSIGSGGSFMGRDWELTGSGAWTGGLAILLTLGIVAMAFALGRSQAQRRLTWVATARTLGATRRNIMAAATFEAAATGVIAGGVGYAAGRLAADAQLAWALSRYPDALLPAQASHPSWVALPAFGLALALAAIVAAVPAFWASRMPPVAALKPVDDVSESEASRRVSPVWAWAIAAVLGAMAIGGFYSSVDAFAFGAPFYAVGAAAAFVAAALDGFRRVAARVGAWMSKRRQPWAMSAGDAITARPRQVATPMLLMFLPTAVAATAMYGALWSYSAYAGGTFGWFAYEPTTIGMALARFSVPGVVDDRGYLVALGVLLLAQLMCVTIALSGARATAADGATQQALGLSARAHQWAAAARHAIPQAIAAVIGVASGVVAVLTFQLLGGNPYSDTEFTGGLVRDSLQVAGFPLLAVALMSLATIATGAAVVALASRFATPVRALAQAR